MKHAKTFEAFIAEKLTAKNPDEVITIDADMAYDDPRDAAIAFKKFGIKVKEVKGGQGTEHEITGKKKDILAYLQSEFYEMDDEDIKDLYPELLEGDQMDEAMVQVSGKSKPAGAKILAMVIVDELEKNGMLKPGVNTNNIKNDVMELIMDNTF
jgi:DNA-directed RNA polymerase subunit F